jgi:protein gp37
MGTKTGIEWCDATFNPWTGCQKVSPACDHCYAETQAKRAPKTFGGWGPGAERKRTSESYWRQPLLWNKRAAKEGVRPRVFCASMADVFDNHRSIDLAWRTALWRLIDATPHLDWLLLTKRPQNIIGMLPNRIRDDGSALPIPNVWLGTTIENQAEADRRIPHLLAAPAAKRFLSMEPLLGPVDLRAARYGHATALQRLDWVIAGGESGAHARPSHPDWFRSLRDQCVSAGVPFFFKQWGEWAPCISGTLVMPDPSAPCPDTMKGGMDAGGAWMRKVGKKAAGALLDGREWREVPHA